jgi:hypothetical protein
LAIARRIDARSVALDLPALAGELARTAGADFAGEANVARVGRAIAHGAAELTIVGGVDANSAAIDEPLLTR